METGLVAFDTETDSLEAVTARILSGSAWPWRRGKRAMCRSGHGGTDLLAENPVQIPDCRSARTIEAIAGRTAF